MDVKINQVSTTLPEDLLLVLSKLVNTAAAEVFLSLPSIFQEVLLVVPGKTTQVVHDLCKAEGIDPIDISAVSDVFALPLERAGELKCWVVISKEEVEQRLNNMEGANLLYSTLLEEFFHINNYSDIWKARGFIHHRTNNECRDYFLNASFKLLDEYIAGRRKADLLSKRSVELAFGKSLPKIMTESINTIYSTIEGFARGKIKFEDASTRINAVILKDIFESLVRESARRSRLVNHSFPLGSPEESPEFTRYIRAYWREIDLHCSNAYQNAAAFSNSEYGISKILESFFNDIGVTFTVQESGGCWMTISNRWINNTV